ncbi:hypothetical protein QBC44DRAFT_319239 [Cladorrhinum sp. PSN332]|nr:hypothetical protein QBC44DRAFT_319239 [Cladorrhinum sp. PSN332]
MRRRLHSLLPSGFRRHGNLKDRAGSQEQGQDGHDIPSVAVVTTPTSQDCEDKPPPTPPTDFAGRDSAIASLPIRLWDRAYNDFKREEMELVDAYEKILSRQLQEGLGSAVPESQPNIIAQDKPDTRRRQMMQLIQSGLAKTEREAKLKKDSSAPVDVVLSAKNVISSAIQAVPQAALAWTGICVALEVLANPITQTEANRKGIDYVTKRMDWYWSLSSSLLKDLPENDPELSGVRHELENRVVDLYKALLSYQIKSVYSYFRNRGLIFFRDMIKLDDWDAELGTIQDAEKSFQDDTQAYNTRKMVSGLDQIAGQGKNQEMRQTLEKDQQCLQHLRLTNPRDDKIRIERTRGGLLQDSYRWVLSNHDFQQWRDHRESRLLWIKGDPGKGKTMLLCGIINELDQGLAANACHSNVAYFFCQATDSRINSATAVLRGLIYMLSDQQPSLLRYVRSEYDRAGKKLFNDANTWDVLLRIFTNILRDPDLRMTCLVIDALDECVTDLPQLLDLIAQKSSQSARVKWIVSSRNWPQIEERLETATQKARLSLELNAESIATAVNAFIKDKVDQLARQKKYDTDMKDKVQAYLHSHANETFLWVALVCQGLADLNVQKRHTLAKLQTFPSGLDSLYARMLEQIGHSEDVELCKQILSVAVTVYRPISLDELTSLVEMPDDVSDDSGSLEEIISLCGSFLTIREKTVYFVHQSAKDFLVGKTSSKLSQDASKWVFSSGIEEVNHAILLRSLDAMSTTLRRDIYGLSVPGFMIDQVPIRDPDPLATVRYSCVYWIDHLCDLVSSTNSTRDVLQANGVIHKFLTTKYLYWLEALSLLGAISDGIKAIGRLRGLLERMNQGQLTAIIQDGYRFALSYGRIIEQAPLQGYTSALIFAPMSSLVKENFKQERPRWLSKGPAVTAEWDACLQTLEGHDGWVHSVAFSHDGKQVASGSADGTIKIWDATSGSCVKTLEGHGDSVRSVTFSYDGKQVASGSDDGTIKIWDATSGSCVKTLEGHGDSVRSVTFSHDGKQVASGSDDGTIKIWDATLGSCVKTLEGHCGWVRSVTLVSYVLV